MKASDDRSIGCFVMVLIVAVVVHGCIISDLCKRLDKLEAAAAVTAPEKTVDAKEGR